MTEDEYGWGLSSSNRSFIVYLTAFLLFIFGPPIPPYGDAAHIAYSIAIPFGLWFVLRRWGTEWNIGPSANDRIHRALLAGVAGGLAVAAYSSATARSHLECDQLVQTSDGQECVGEYVRVKGGDAGVGIMLLVFSIASFAVAIRSDAD